MIRMRTTKRVAAKRVHGDVWYIGQTTSSEVIVTTDPSDAQTFAKLPVGYRAEGWRLCKVTY